MSASRTHTYPGCGLAWPCWQQTDSSRNHYTSEGVITQPTELKIGASVHRCDTGSGSFSPELTHYPKSRVARKSTVCRLQFLGQYALTLHFRGVSLPFSCHARTNG